MAIAQAALVVAMIAVSAYGALVLPRDARVPVHFGLGSYNSWVPKTAGLLLWPAIGVLVYFLVGVLAGRDAGRGGRPIGLTLALAVILATQLGAVRLAVRRGRRR